MNEPTGLETLEDVLDAYVASDVGQTARLTNGFGGTPSLSERSSSSQPVGA